MMLVLLVSLLGLQAQVKYEMHYYVAPDTTNHYLHVTLDYQQGLKVGDDTSEKMPNTRELVLNMPRWAPGYYQILDFAKHLCDFSATDSKGNPIKLPLRKARGAQYRLCRSTRRLHAC